MCWYKPHLTIFTEIKLLEKTLPQCTLCNASVDRHIGQATRTHWFLCSWLFVSCRDNAHKTSRQYGDITFYYIISVLSCILLIRYNWIYKTRPNFHFYLLFYHGVPWSYWHANRRPRHVWKINHWWHICREILQTKCLKSKNCHQFVPSDLINSVNLHNRT